MISREYTEALERALGRVIADAQRQVELQAARGDAAISELRARNAELLGRLDAAERAISDAVEQGIAEGIRAVLDASAAADQERVEGMRAIVVRLDAINVLSERLAVVEARAPEVTRADLDEISASIGGAFEQIDGIRKMEGPAGERGEPGEAGPPGRDVDPEVVREMIAEAVAALPAAEKGERGEPGEVGPRGADGAPGRLSVARAWSDDVHYEGQVVTHGGGTWQAVRDTGREPPHEDWHCLAAPGAPGAGFGIPQPYKEGESYAERDVVIVGGSAFVARHNDPGKCPGDGWQLFAGRGKTGKPGERGAKGNPGASVKGPPGAPVLGMDVSEEGVLTLKNGDGSTVEADFYPLFDKVRS